MALIKCKECGHEVSTEAQACPHCGAVQKKKQEEKKKEEKKKGSHGCLVPLLIVGGIILLVIIGGQNSSKDSSPSKPSVPKEVVYNSEWDGSVRQVEQWFDKNLKDPDSFEAVEWGKVVKLDDGLGFAVRCKYRAKNSFGGYNVEHKLFTLDPKGNIILVADYE